MIAKKTKIISGALSIIFLLFAIVQYNDPDSWKWIIAYMVPTLLFSLLLLGHYFYKAGRIALIIFIFSALLYIPDLWEWMSIGMPSITESMEAEEPLVEFMREFLGLIILCLTMYYYNSMVRPSNQNPELRT